MTKTKSKSKTNTNSLVDQLLKQDSKERYKSFLRLSRDKPRELFPKLADQPPLEMHDLRGHRTILVSRWVDVVEVLMRHKDFTVRENVRTMDPTVGPFMLSRDGQDENWRDKAIMQTVLPLDDVDTIRQRARFLATNGLAGGSGVVDLMPSVARAVPLCLIQEYLGFEGKNVDAAHLSAWSQALQHDMFRNPLGNSVVHRAALQAGQDLQAWIRQKISDEHCRDRSGPKRSTIAKLLHGPAAAQMASNDRMVSNIAGLLVGTLETAAEAIAKAALEMLHRKDVRAAAKKLVNKEDWVGFDRVVNEALRFQSASPMVVRTCASDTRIGEGKTDAENIGAGDVLMVVLAAAMFDEARFPDPEAFNCDRVSPGYLHLGLGHHQCLGANIAPAIVGGAVAAIVENPGLELMPGQEPYILSNPFPQSLPVVVGGQEAAISELTINRAGYNTEARPHPFTTHADYTTWEGQRNLTFTGRHLPPVGEYDQRHLPEEDELLSLFKRRSTEGDNNCVRSSLLFAGFAQWFTDSFLRTAHGLTFDSDGNAKVDEVGHPRRDPDRYQRNASNHQIDLCQIYGLNENVTKALRFDDTCEDPLDRGCLRYQDIGDDKFPEFLLKNAPATKKTKLNIRKRFAEVFPDERLLRFIFRSAADNGDEGYETIFTVGLEHGNSTLSNSLFNVIFMREHNRLAREISRAHHDWDGDRVFQTTRNAMIATLIKIVVSDYIRHISPGNLPLQFVPGFAERQQWYRQNRIAIEFNLLYRWHALMPTEFEFLPGNSRVNGFRHNNAWLIGTGIRRTVEIFSRTPAAKLTLGNTPHYLLPVEVDTIAMMRNARLQPFNDYRERFKLARIKNFDELCDDERIARKLHNLYRGDIDAVEWYIGLLAERHGPGMIMGELMTAMVSHDAFTQALTNPLLSKQLFNADTFSKTGWDSIHNTNSLKDIVERVVTDLEVDHCSFNVPPLSPRLS